MQTHWSSVKSGDRRFPGWADQCFHEQLGESWVPHIESCHMLQSSVTLSSPCCQSTVLESSCGAPQELEGGTLVVTKTDYIKTF